MKARVLARLEDLGATLFRINLSHTALADVSEVIDFIQQHSVVPVCLDTEGARLVIETINKLAKRGRTIVVFSHNPQILAAAPQYVDLNSKPVPKLVRNKKDDKGPVPLEAVPTPAKESGS